MAIGTTQGRKLTAHGIIKEALQRARIISGAEEPEGSDVTMGLGWLVTNLQEWQAADTMIRNIERSTVTLVTDQASYTSSDGVPTDIIEVQFPATITRSDGKDQQVFQMTHERYGEISDKNFSAIPSELLVEHLSSGTKLTLYPRPNSTVTSLSFWRHRFVYDAAAAGNDLDLRHMYQKAVIIQLAGDFADHYKQTSLAKTLKAEYRELRETVKTGSGDSNDIQFLVPW